MTNDEHLVPGNARSRSARGLIVDLFAGPGGWSEGLRSIGLADVGIEFDEAACATRAAAGHLTIRADVSQYPPERFIGCWGLIASPPCPAFSAAGLGKGREHIGALIAAVRDERWDARPDPDPKVWLVLEPGRWASILRPEWMAFEQVPHVAPLWAEYARTFRRWGYSTWSGVLNSADYGVPQTRERAILLASRTGRVVPPQPSHAEKPALDLFGDVLERWVSMAEGLGWGISDEPCGTVMAGSNRQGGPSPLDGGSGSRERYRKAEDYKRSSDRPSPTLTTQAGAFWQWEKPATTICGDPRITARCHHDEGSQGANAKTTEQVRAGDYEGTEPIKLTIDEALILQSFRADYPVTGGRSKQFEQIGNAVPPVLAAATIGALTGAADPSYSGESRAVD